MTTRAGVVVIQTEQAVMKSEPAQMGKLFVDLSTQPLFKTQSDSASKLMLPEKRGQLLIQSVIATARRSSGR